MVHKLIERNDKIMPKKLLLNNKKVDNGNIIAEYVVDTGYEYTPYLYEADDTIPSGYKGEKITPDEVTQTDNGDGTTTIIIKDNRKIGKINFGLIGQIPNSSHLLRVNSIRNSDLVDIASMFYSCTNLTYINSKGLVTSKVKNMSSVFYRCLILPSIDTTDWDTSNVTNMLSIFANCEALVSIDMSN